MPYVTVKNQQKLHMRHIAPVLDLTCVALNDKLQGQSRFKPQKVELRCMLPLSTKYQEVLCLCWESNVPYYQI